MDLNKIRSLLTEFGHPETAGLVSQAVHDRRREILAELSLITGTKRTSTALRAARAAVATRDKKPRRKLGKSSATVAMPFGPRTAARVRSVVVNNVGRGKR